MAAYGRFVSWDIRAAHGWLGYSGGTQAVLRRYSGVDGRLIRASPCLPTPPPLPPQTYILDGNLYDSKFLEGGTQASTENGTESVEDLEVCALLLNKKKVRGRINGGRILGCARCC